MMTAALAVVAENINTSGCQEYVKPWPKGQHLKIVCSPGMGP